MARRHLYLVMGSHSLPYAGLCIDTLLRHVREEVSLTLITDGRDDVSRIEDAVAKLDCPANQKWQVVGRHEIDARAGSEFRSLPHLRQFRDGHPCWRKITDPLLLAGPGAEVVILDPDLFFPNRFTFEPTPDSGLRLMWQPPHCLLPGEIVERAYAIPVRLAHHTDIGVAQFNNTLDLGWLDDLIGHLGGASIPRVMHVESIVWAALAMRCGGTYLNSRHWYCWRNRHWKRALRACGVSGERMLSFEPFRTLKCFHAGGAAKWWLPAAYRRGLCGEPSDIVESAAGSRYTELTPAAYRRGQLPKRVARAMGYYAIVGR